MQNKTKAHAALAASAVLAAGTLPGFSPLANLVTTQTGGIILGFLNHGFVAATIGGLADWFAVTALFRKPLGISYRTEILKRNRARITDAIIEYVEKDLLNTENIMAAVREENTAALLIEFFENHQGRAKTHELFREVLKEIFSETDSGKISKLVAPILDKEIKSFEAEKIIDAAVKIVSDERHSRKILTAFLSAGEKILKSEHMQEALREKISELLAVYEGDSAGRSLVLSSLNLTDEKILSVLNENVERKISETEKILNITGMVDSETADKLKNLMDTFSGFVKNSAANLNVGKVQTEFQKVFSNKFNTADYMKTWIDVNIKGNDDPEMLEKIQLEIRATPNHGRIMEVERNEPVWHAPLDKLIDDKIDEFINSEELQKKLDDIIKNFIEKILKEYHDQIPALIRERLDKLSDDELTKFVEGKVSDDLQMIRINGSVCGAAAGMFLYIVSLVIEKIIG
ncbi:MAG: DUF445 domain-containing protein [Selenomonadaceae bacterium]|nr:DUF445 domain-containing protein [Selenomonadaceae bacterium]